MNRLHFRARRPASGRPASTAPFPPRTSFRPVPAPHPAAAGWVRLWKPDLLLGLAEPLSRHHE